MTVTASRGTPRSSKTLVMPSAIFCLFSLVMPDHIETCTTGTIITERGKADLLFTGSVAAYHFRRFKNGFALLCCGVFKLKIQRFW